MSCEKGPLEDLECYNLATELAKCMRTARAIPTERNF